VALASAVHSCASGWPSVANAHAVFALALIKALKVITGRWASRLATALPFLMAESIAIPVVS